jgi:hypothetical protein
MIARKSLGSTVIPVVSTRYGQFRLGGPRVFNSLLYGLTLGYYMMHTFPKGRQRSIFGQFLYCSVLGVKHASKYGTPQLVTER